MLNGRQILLQLIFISVLFNVTNAKGFIWISGSKTTNQNGIYGTKGVPDPNNVPGSRRYAVSWIDSENNLYLFGGIWFESGSYGRLNDLWKFDGTNWTWISGSKTRGQNGIYGTKGVPDPINVPGSRGYAVSWIDSENNLYLFGGYGYPESGSFGYLNDLWKFDGTHHCHGKNADNPSVCSGRGACESQDNCVCNENWFGKQCNITQCFSILSNDSSACNGHGNCTDYNVCICEEGWNSNQCNIPTCFGKIASETSVCSGRGKCIGIDQCKCDPKYLGDECTKDRLIIVYAATANIPSWSWMSILMILYLFVW
jgi:hypothetical protein